MAADVKSSRRFMKAADWSIWVRMEPMLDIFWVLSIEPREKTYKKTVYYQQIQFVQVIFRIHRAKN